MDVAELGYSINSREALVAGRNLDTMNASARRADAVARGLTTRVLALGAAFGVAFSLQGSINQARQLDAAIGELSTLLPGATSELNRMTAAARDFATTYGTGSQAQVSAYYAAVSAGATNAAQATARVDAANRLAIGGASNLAAAIEILNTATNAYADSGLTAADASDILFTGVRTGVTTINELSSTIGRAVPAAAALGVEFDQLVGGVSALTTQGQSTDIAVTSLTAAMSQLLNPSEQARQIARQLGIDFSATAVQAMGLAGFMEMVTEAAGGNQETLAQLFGSVEALRAVFSLAGQGGVRFAAIMEEMESRAGAADAAYQTMADRMSNRFNRVMSEAGKRVEEVGDILLSVFVVAAERAIAVVEAFEQPTLALEVAMKAAAVTAGVLLVTRLYSLTAALAANAASAIAATGTYTIYNMVLIRYGQSAAIAAAATHALGVAVKVALGPIGLAIAAVGLITAGWVAYSRSSREVQYATEDLNTLLEEQARLNGDQVEVTRELTQERLGNAMAIREETAAIIEQRREMLRAQYDALAGPSYLGASRTDAADRAALSAIRVIQQQIAQAEADQAANLEHIAELRAVIAGFDEEAATAVREERRAQDAKFAAILEGLDQEYYAMTTNRAEAEARLAVYRAQDQVGRTLLETEENLLRTALERNRLRSDEVRMYERVRGSVLDYQEQVAALDRLMQQGAITASEYWAEVLNMRLPGAGADLDAYLRSFGAALDPLQLQVQAANDSSLPGMSGFNDLMTNPALAGEGSEIERLRSDYAERLALVQQMQEAETLTIEEAAMRRAEIERASMMERTDLLRSAYAVQLSAASSAFDSIANATAAFAGEQSGVYKAMFAISKAFAIAESVINIQRAMAQAIAVPFPANIPAMAMVAAEGASIISAIQAVANTGFMAGGYTGNGGIGDVAGVVHGREYVLNNRATAGIGRDALDYMNRNASLPPANDRAANDGGGVTYDFSGMTINAGSDVSRAEVTAAVREGVREGIQSQGPGMVRQTLRENQELSGSAF